MGFIKKMICFTLLSFLIISEGGCATMTPVKVTLETSKGDVTLELYPDKAPETVKNFLSYVDSGFFNLTLFHRVIPGFMVQGGGFGKGLVHKEAHQPVKNEAANGLTNQRGTIAMARTSDPHSATSQFFINLVDNDFLNFTAATDKGYGYCVFGKVIAGMDVVDKIAAVKTHSVDMYQDVPVEDVFILKATKVK
jgi:peptidyl-prolyl cis-trans isomerase B (cyclophilin B)